MNKLGNKYYLGGYYLILLKPIDYGSDEGALIYSCSECLNVNLVDEWSYSWTDIGSKSVKEAKENFKLSDSQIELIRSWVDRKYIDNKIGWINVFTDRKTALEYKEKFFSHLPDIKLLAIYFDQSERTDLLKEMKPPSKKNGEIGLCLTLLKEVEEVNNEIFLGYDYIGIQYGGSFHTFHCHDIGRELSDKFGLSLNEYGLFKTDLHSKEVLEYLNNEENECEPDPWFIVKTKLVTKE